MSKNNNQYSFNGKKICIIGHARHGKDTLAEIFKQQLNMKFSSSSEFACNLFIYEKLKDIYNYNNPKECFDDRIYKRKDWFDLITKYNEKDKSRLAKEILKENDCYVGLRNKDELLKCIQDNIFDFIIWVDASQREQLETNRSITVTKDFADIIIENNTTIEEFEKKALRLIELIKN